MTALLFYKKGDVIMKILLISGHGAGDSGAIGNGYKEADLTVEVVKLLKPMLEAYGATVSVYPYERNAYKDITNGCLKVNFANYDYVFEVHFNAGGGVGTEIYVTSKEKATSVEQEVMDKLSKYYKVRGVKVMDFLVIKTAKNKGVSSALLETCFIDSSSDVKTYQSNKNAIVQAIADGIAEGFGLKKVKIVAVGSTVKVASNAVVGGLASNRGQACSTYLKSKTWKVSKIQTNKGVQESLLDGANTWVAIKYLTVA
jgi:N-acetylmuramoyl-L-alanine amidase